MMADIEDTSQEALTIEEIARATDLGLSVMSCPKCSRPTLWMRNRENSNEPKDCGRVPCREGYGAEEK